MAIDHFGITAPGESWKAIEDGKLERDGSIPMNPSGGLIGGGHPGSEACLSTARLGLKTLLVTGNINMIASMPCNPSVGGPAKGIVVREIDALGGEMARNADKTQIHP